MMSLTSCRVRHSSGWLGRCLLGCVLLLCLPAAAPQLSSRYAGGLWRRGRRLLGAAPLLRRPVASAVQCLSLCARSELCAALQVAAVAPRLSCEMFAERACDGHRLEADAGVNYFDVYRQPAAEARHASLWRHQRCTGDGYCSSSCVDELCAAGSCSSQLLPSAFLCSGGLCQVTDRFWEVGSGLVLPRWMDWTASPMVTTVKQLKPDTCALNVSVKLDGAAFVFGVASTDASPQSRRPS